MALSLLRKIIDVRWTSLSCDNTTKLEHRIAGTRRTSTAFGFSYSFHLKEARGFLPGDILATLLLTIQAENLFTANIGERALVGDAQDSLNLSDRLALTEQLSNGTADVIGQKRLDVDIASFGLAGQVGCVGVTGNTRHVTDELGSRLLLRLFRRAGLDAARHRFVFSCGTHIANTIMVEPLLNGKEKF